MRGQQIVGGAVMPKHVFMSFDYDHDNDLQIMLAGQAKHDDSPFDLVDKSLKEPYVGDWRTKIRRRIGACDLMIVICGEYTHTATGVSDEIEIARDLGIPYFLLWGRSEKTCTKPKSALSSDQIYKWNWDNL